MKISLKLTLFFSGVVVLFIGLADALISQNRALVSGYDDLLNTAIQPADLARVTQVDFKKQVQEWKDILLRGHDPQDLAKYTQQFHDAETRVRDQALALSRQVRDPEVARLLGEFLARHADLGKKYQEAYGVYAGGDFDFKAADRIVRGMDRPPTDLFDQVVSRLSATAGESRQRLQASAAHKQLLALAVTGGCLLLLCAGGLFVVLSVSRRLACLKEISDHLAKGELAGLAIDINGDDEVGEFGRSLQGIHGAIADLAAAKGGGSELMS